jgi:hypothetical protein
MKRTLTCLAILAGAVILTTSPTRANWAATPFLSPLGLNALTCQGEFCVGISCSAGRIWLYSMAPGGGPFEGNATVSVDGQRWPVTFVDDPRILQRLNFTGTRAEVPTSAIAAMRSGRSLVINGTTSDRFTFRSGFSGLPRLLANASCP